jgi:hypothetical protein
MSNTNGNGGKKGINFRASNPPNKNGNGPDWDNYGNVFIDAQGKHGTLYLDVSNQQLQALLGKADAEGRVKVKVFLHAGKGKASGGASTEAAA